MRSISRDSDQRSLERSKLKVCGPSEQKNDKCGENIRTADGAEVSDKTNVA